VEYFVYGRDNEGTAQLRQEVTEQHWSFMDGYVESIVARGPTVAEDGVTATGSMHIVDLPDVEAVRVFAFEEPYYKAGVFAEVMVRRWHNLLGGTIWALAVDSREADRFLVVGHGTSGVKASSDGLLAAQHDFVTKHPHRDRLVVCGPLLSDDGASWVGNVVAIERVTRSIVEAMLENDPFARAGLYDRVEIHRWRFGGRR
jgi:uncharacterized protein YciI